MIPLSKIYIFFILFCCVFIGTTTAYENNTEYYPFGGFSIEPGDLNLVSDENSPPIIENEHLYTSFIDLALKNLYNLGQFPAYLSELIFISTVLLTSGALAIFYTRIKLSEDPNSRPMKILHYITENPGSLQIDIIHGTNFSRGSVAYNLKRLENEGKIKKNSVNEIMLYYPTRVIFSENEFMLQILKNKNARKIFETILSNPNISQNTLGQELQIPITTLRWHLRRLERYEVISLTKENHLTQYTVSQKSAKEYFSLLKISDASADKVEIKS